MGGFVPFGVGGVTFLLCVVCWFVFLFFGTLVLPMVVVVLLIVAVDVPIIVADFVAVTAASVVRCHFRSR